MLRTRLLWVWGAFHELATCRPAAQVIMPIPWVAINQWAVARNVADTERFELLIRALDQELMESLASDKPKPKTRGARGRADPTPGD